MTPSPEVREAVERPPIRVQQFDDETWTVWLGNVRLTSFPSLPGAEDCAEKIRAYVADSAGEGLRPFACDAQRKSNGERLCEAFAETFQGGGWTDAPAWDDFDESQQDRWNRTAEIYLLNVAVVMEPDSPSDLKGEG